MRIQTKALVSTHKFSGVVLMRGPCSLVQRVSCATETHDASNNRSKLCNLHSNWGKYLQGTVERKKLEKLIQFDLIVVQFSSVPGGFHHVLHNPQRRLIQALQAPNVAPIFPQI